MILMNVVNTLQKRNNSLKSKLRHQQLKYGTYSFNKVNKELLLVLDAYKNHKSIFKAASSVGVNKDMAIKCFIQGMDSNSEFRDYYLTINRINGFVPESHENMHSDVGKTKNEYNISASGDAWVYTTCVDGENISIISCNLDQLRHKVKSRGLPLV